MKGTIILLLLLCVQSSQAQTVPTCQQLTTTAGLSQGMIFDILQSRDGFIWIATKDGLNRYDGSRFEVFSPDPFNPFSIGNGDVHKIFEDSRGWIWIVLPNGLDVFDPERGLFFHVKHEGISPSGKNEISLLEIPDGDIWFSDNNQVWKINAPNDLLAKAAKQGTAVIEPVCKAIHTELSGSALKAEFLLFSKEKKLLIGTSDGLFRLDPATEKISPELPKPGWLIRGLSSDAAGNIIAMAKENDQITWIWMSRNQTQFFKDNAPNLSNTFSLSPDGFLWVFRGQRIQKWQVSALFNQGKPELEINPGALVGNDLMKCTKFMFDKSGVVWVGTNGYGLISISQKAPNFKNYLPNLSQRQLLEAPDGSIFTLFNPSFKYPSKSFQAVTTHADFFSSHFQNGLDDSWASFAACFDAAGNGWSTNRSVGKLFRTDAQTKSVKSFTFLAGYGLIVDRTGALLSLSEKGLVRFDPKTETATEFPFEKPQKKASLFSHFLHEDRDGAVWMFGWEGLTKAVPDASGYRFEYFRNNPADRSSLSSDVVLSVADDPLEPARYLWVGTKSGGLNRLDKKTNQFRQFKTTDGLPDNVVYGILAENAKPFIWLSTNKGLCRFHVRDETTKNFTAADGLQDNEFNSSSYLKTRDGTMLFGGVDGLTVFHPDSLRFNDNVPQIHLVGLQVNNRKYEVWGKSSITLAHDQNLLTFDFAALEFTNSAQNQYRYQLVGVDKNWVSLGTRNSVQFANLAPGDYTFKVDGSNNDGVWSAQPAELHFTIRPPWWASWWAYLLYLGMAAAAIRVFYRNRLRQKLEQQETLRLKELDDFKSRFFTNITHEFRTPLTVMLGMSEQLAKAETDEPKRNKLGLIKRSGENLLRLVNQILDLAKLESNALKMNYIQGDILTYIRYIAESLHSLANAQNLMLRVESEQAKIVMDYDPERFLQIIHNLLSNAVKFTPSGGKVIVRADLEGNWLKISVSDSGVGIPASELPHLFERFFQAKNQEQAKAGGTGIGLSLTRELVRAMGGEISVESTVGAGSTFFVKLPVTNNSAFEESHFAEDLKSRRVEKPRVAVAQDHPDTAPHILLIEDNPDVVEYLTACLQGHFALDFAYNGQAGIEKALETVPDLIVSDVMMPIKDGFEVVENLKNDERTSHIPIILLTAKADVQSRLAGLRRGADVYLSKPFHQEELLVTVENLLELRRKLQVKYQQNAFASVASSPEIAADLEDSFLQKVRAIVEANFADEDFGLPQLCQKLGMSRSQLFRKMKALTDITPADLIRKHRLNRAKTLLESGSANVAEAAWQVGFKDPSYFSKLYQEEFGETPSETRK